ncbi:MAG: hypothetical protein WDN00_07160 [Limisphaerales bacterium]
MSIGKVKAAVFSRAGLRDADEVVAGEDLGNRRRLDGRGFRVAGFLHGLQNFRIETQCAE